MLGIANNHEYYTQHYFEEVLSGDLKDTLTRWRDLATEHPDSEAHREPHARLRSLIRDYFRAIEKFQKAATPPARLAAQQAWLPSFLDTLGYRWSPTWITLGSHAKSPRIPLIAAEAKQSGAPALWIIEALPEDRSEDDIAVSPLSLSPRSAQYTSDPQANDPQILGTRPPRDLTWEEVVSKFVFSQEEPPRWVLLVSLGHLVLIDRLKWPERRFLDFDLREIFNRREDETLKSLVALLHCESTCPADGLPLHDGLDENSHKNAFSVSEDLKLAIVASVEDLANEAVYFIRKERAEGRLRGLPLFSDDITKDIEQKLTRGCLRYLYRMLFCFYLEARPELGYLPVKSEEYLKGYSIESLRDLELVELDDRSAEGFFFHESIKTLFHLIFEGRQHHGATTVMDFDSDKASSIHDDFEIAPLKSHLFDPEGTPYLSKVRFRNKVLQKIVFRLSIGQQGTGRSRRPGRISYATLGINQLGAVYENLLSYSGFFAKEELYEVKPAGEEHNPLQHAYFVTGSQLSDYEPDERVNTKDPVTGADSLLRHAKGRFIYRLAGRARKKSASYYTPESLTQCLVKYALKERLKDLKADDILKLTVCEMAVGSAAFLNEAVNQLAEAYLQLKQKETGITIPHEDYTQERQKVKMYIADNNVFGVDLNPTAVELAEISLWLNTIYEGAFVPWFGLQLANGNSLIGARRETYPTHLLLPRKGKGGAKARWPEEPPAPIGKCEVGSVNGDKSEDLKLQTSPFKLQRRPSDGVYHWLLGDPGMSNYTDKVIKQLARPKLDEIKKWKTSFVSPFADDDIDELLHLSQAADTLFQRHLEASQRLRRETTDTLTVFGQEAKLEISPRMRTTTHEKDLRWAKEIKHPYSPYSRLKLAMDYWCSLWFWPIEKAELLPTRQQFLTEMGFLLGHLPGLAPEPSQGEFDSLLVEIGGNQVKVKQDDLELDEVIVDTAKACRDSKRLELVKQISDERKFFHWELEYVDLFAERGGFDLILGNPPWVKVEWNEGDLLSERNPAFAIRKLSASQIAKAREEQLEQIKQREAYFAEYTEFSGTQSFLNATQNYSLLKGQQTNLYKCFIPRAWSLTSNDGTTGLIHPEGIYDDTKGGPLRASLYPRLRSHYQFQNVLKLFPEIMHWVVFSLNIYHSPRKPISFSSISNLFHPRTISETFQHGGSSITPGIKNANDQWELEGHKNRLIEVNGEALKLFASLYDKTETPIREARLPAIHARELLDVLRKLNQHKTRLSSLKEGVVFFEMWHETNAQKDGTIRRETAFPSCRTDLVLSGPHFFVARPLYKSPRAICQKHHDYDIIDLETVDDNYLPRTNYIPDCTPTEFSNRTPIVNWGTRRSACSFFRLVCRKMMFAAGERTLIPSVVPDGVSHIDGCVSLAFKDSKMLIDCAASLSSIPCDFIIKTTGKSNFRNELASILPLPDGAPNTRIRILALNCLTTHYAALWSECWDDHFNTMNWYGKDPRLDECFWRKLSPEWQHSCALRSDFVRRWALLELDVLVARKLGLALKELQTIYRLQFPVMKQFEADTWYDQNGRIVFTNNSQGLPGVGFDRKEWNEISHLESGTVSRTITDTTLPTGPVERTIEYVAPFTRCNREQDYATVWAALDAEEGLTKQDENLQILDIPAPDWMDRPLVLPTAARGKLTPNYYRSLVLPQLIYQSGGKVPFERYRRAYWLLAEPKVLQRFARGTVGPVANTWASSFHDKLEKDMFISDLKSSTKRNLHIATIENERWIQLRRTDHIAFDEHAVFDARLALLVADLWPAEEPIEPLTTEDEAAIRELELAH